MRFKFSKTAQSTIEIAIVTVILVAALVCMSRYVTRAVQGRFKAGADTISERQYAIGKTVITGGQTITTER